MRDTTHIEHHFTATETVRDVVIGMSDGLTVPFALAAGLSGAKVGSAVIVLAGLAEIAAGSIAMGLGGYLAARTDMEHYESELQREIDETHRIPEQEAAEVGEIFEGWGLTPAQIAPIITAISSDEKRWVDFMMRFELGLERPDPKRALWSAATIAASYIAGGFIPLAPYFFVADVQQGLAISMAVTLTALLVFGCIKARFTGIPLWRGGLQTTLIGGLAAGAAFGIARLFR
ncbi:MAG TPA: VIT1/CCC1 transporter family protein [Bryobacteraceae bacterium]|jgi:VIT1/CCC1 family predicted Fe2+/Mn2+ transporter|nr:VIT1/CCC1 transporter family protein [Bryobacteraceae bacterium]